MHNNNYKGPERKLQHRDHLPHTQRFAPRWQMCGSGMAGAAVGLGTARPAPGKTSLSCKLRFTLVTRPAIQVQRNDSIGSSSWRAWPSRRELLSWSVPSRRAQWTLRTSHSRYQAPSAWMHRSRLETTSGANIAVYAIQRRLDSPKDLLLLQWMTVCSLIFFMLGFKTHQSKKEATKTVLGRALMLTCFATAIPCKLMKAPLGTSGYMAGGTLLHTVIQLCLTARSPQLGCLATPWRQACRRWVTGEMGFLPGAHFAGLFSQEATSTHPPSSGREKLMLEGSPDSAAQGTASMAVLVWVDTGAKNAPALSSLAFTHGEGARALSLKDRLWLPTGIRECLCLWGTQA